MKCFAVLLFAFAALATSASDRFVGAYYYPWYYPSRWTNEPVANLPRGGFYDSSDRAVVAQHLAWAKQADVDFLLVSWVSTNGYENRNLRDALLPEIEKTDRTFCLLYETPLALHIPAGQRIDLATVTNGATVGDAFVAQIDYLAATYLKHPRYLQFNGRAVLVIYLVRDLLNAGPYLKTVRERLKGQGIDLYLIADSVYWAPPEKQDWPMLKENFQALTAYNMYYRTNFLPAVRAQFRRTADLAAEHGLALIPNVLPGYDDTPLRGTDRVTLHRLHGKFYDDNWRLAAEFVSDRQPFVLITSFNEWHEGTAIEPSREFGEQYLEATRRNAAELRR